MLRMLTMILFLLSIQLASAQKETSLKIHFDANLGLELEREIAPKFSLTLKSEYNVNQDLPFYCLRDSFFDTIDLLDTVFFNPVKYDIITTSIGGRFYPFLNQGNLGLYTGLSLNHQYSKKREENALSKHQFFIEIPFGYKWRFAKRFLFEFGYTTSIIQVNNEVCENHKELDLSGSFFIMAGYQITKNNTNEEESIHPAAK